jgi:hypothetical protein
VIKQQRDWNCSALHPGSGAAREWQLQARWQRPCSPSNEPELEQDQRAAKKVEKQKADNDPTVWEATVEDSKRAQETVQEQRRQTMMKAFEETVAAQVEVDWLIAQMTRLGLQQETLSNHTLDEVRKMVARAGLRVAEGARKQEEMAVFRYQLLHCMVNIRSDDQTLVLETRVLPVKEILEIQKGIVVFIVTLPQGA